VGRDPKGEECTNEFRARKETRRERKKEWLHISVLVVGQPGQITQGGLNGGRREQTSCRINKCLGILQGIIELALVFRVLRIPGSILGGVIKLVTNLPREREGEE